MKNKYISFFLKAILAGIFAFVILNIICIFYYNVPIHSHSETRSTDYAWEKNKFYSRGTEGFAWGFTDENGFNNLETFEKGEIDVLALGSSHLEGFNVPQDKNAVAQLNKLFDEAGMNLDAYNIGISGHTIPRCLYNLENAVDEFQPTKYVVIEVSSLKYDVEEMEQAVNNSLEPIESNNGGIVGQLQKFPFLRRTYSQLKSATRDEEELPKEGDHLGLLGKMLDKVVPQIQEKGLELIIVYNGSLTYGERGQIVAPEDQELVAGYKDACESRGITFVYMGEPYVDYYNKTKIFPHGFSNSEAGFGHLNQYGHKLVADELFKTICNMEAK